MMHSPGPWKVVNNFKCHDADGTAIVDANGELVIGAYSDCWSRSVDGVCVIDRDDAHLIAAAPRMLELLRSLAGEWHSPDLLKILREKSRDLLAELDK